MGICDLRNSVFTDEWGWEEERRKRFCFQLKERSVWSRFSFTSAC